MRRKIHITDLSLFFGICLLIISKMVHIGTPSGYYAANVINGYDDEHQVINDSLMYYQYKHLADSLDRIASCKRQELVNTGDGVSSPLVGFKHSEPSGICEEILAEGDYKTGERYYLELPGYALYPNTEFYIDQGKYFLRAANQENYLLTGNKEIKVRYADDNWEGGGINKGLGKVLIPISASQYKIVKVCVYVLSGAILIYGLWIFLVLPLRILFGIAAGRAFSPIVVRDIFTIGWSLMAMAVFFALASLIFTIAFHSSIPQELYLSFPGSFLLSRDLLLYGMTVFLVGCAFQHGYRVKLDSDLAI